MLYRCYLWSALLFTIHHLQLICSGSVLAKIFCVKKKKQAKTAIQWNAWSFAYFWIESGKELDKRMELFSGIIIFNKVCNMKNICDIWIFTVSITYIINQQTQDWTKQTCKEYTATVQYLRRDFSFLKYPTNLISSSMLKKPFSSPSLSMISTGSSITWEDRE